MPRQGNVWGWTVTSPWLLVLVLIGVFGWLTPMVSAARRSHRSPASVPVVTSEEIVIPVRSTGELCVRGTAISESNRIAVLGERTVSLGETIRWDGLSYRVVTIDAEAVRLKRTVDAASTAATNQAVR